MFNTFKNQVKHLFESKGRIASYVILLLIPMIYSGITISAFWEPFHNVDKLKVVVVNLDKNAKANELTKLLVGNSHAKLGSKDFQFNIQDATSIYKTREEAEEAVNDGDVAAAVVIPRGYTSALNTFLQDALAMPTSTHTQSQIVAEAFIKGSQQNTRVKFINGYKYNFIKGEMTNMGSAIADFHKKVMFPTLMLAKADIAKIKTLISGNIFSTQTSITDILKKVTSAIAAFNSNTGTTLAQAKQDFLKFKNDLMTKIGILLKNRLSQAQGIATSADVKLIISNFNLLNTQQRIAGLSKITALLITKNNSPAIPMVLKLAMGEDPLQHLKDFFIHKEVLGKNIDRYGKGFSPYFIAISLGSGALMGAFIIKNKRYFNKKQGTFKTFFGKSLVGQLTAFIQGSLLTLGITLLGVLPATGGSSAGELGLYILFVASMFAFMVQAIGSMWRYADTGKFLGVIILILNLVASSGSFPAFMLPAFFEAISKFLPFTYVIDGMRQIFGEPDTVEILKMMGCLLIFPAIMVPIALTLNYVHDRKTIFSTGIYNSYEITTGDL